MGTQRRRGGWKQWTAEEARRAIAGWEASGLPLATYARRQGLSSQRLRWWRDRLKVSPRPAVSAIAAELVPAIITGGAAPSGPVVTLHLADGLVLEVSDPGTVAPEWLVAVASGLARVR